MPTLDFILEERRRKKEEEERARVKGAASRLLNRVRQWRPPGQATRWKLPCTQWASEVLAFPALARWVSARDLDMRR